MTWVLAAKIEDYDYRREQVIWVDWCDAVVGHVVLDGWQVVEVYS